MKHLLYPVLLGLALAGCSQAEQEESVIYPQAAADSSSPLSSAVAPGRPAETARSIIYHGELSLAVDNFEQVSGQVDRLLTEHGAFVSTAHETRADGQHRQEITIKVPPTQFMPLLQTLGKLGRIENKDISSSDVTADLLHVSNELKTKREAESRYAQLLKQAKTPAEIQRLEAQVSQVRAEITASEAQAKTWTGQSTWATLTLRYFQHIPAEEAAPPMPDAAPRFLAAFNRGWSLVVSVAVLLTNIWPLLVLGIGGSWLWRRWQLRQQTPA
ncbi:DUF4349 domain-containing protein [Hymenobacter sp. BT635]|uniref:DUF4349 domain-containing protein n=1 Tax=Hymenobacter nitidus TaxID=2880929 RepID=A0ABS8A8C4_9BACT|nr:DUF4349 domain-containing protein [Hymenobacter nitidus]MCB2376645.1 DUF4349 domain-containing protein [Hymenobacter nitidus]